MSLKPVADALRMLLDKELNPDENVIVSPLWGPKLRRWRDKLEKARCWRRKANSDAPKLSQPAAYLVNDSGAELAVGRRRVREVRPAC